MHKTTERQYLMEVAARRTYAFMLCLGREHGGFCRMDPIHVLTTPVDFPGLGLTCLADHWPAKSIRPGAQINRLTAAGLVERFMADGALFARLPLYFADIAQVAEIFSGERPLRVAGPDFSAVGPVLDEWPAWDGVNAWGIKNKREAATKKAQGVSSTDEGESHVE